jgi:hypothetical protein
MMDRKETPELISDVLAVAERCGASQEQLEHLSVLLSAFAVYVERNERHGSLWKKFGWMDSIVSVRGKAARCVQQWYGPQTLEGGPGADLDDAVDLINFAVFLIRNVQTNNKWGDG